MEAAAAAVLIALSGAAGWLAATGEPAGAWTALVVLPALAGTVWLLRRAMDRALASRIQMIRNQTLPGAPKEEPPALSHSPDEAVREVVEELRRVLQDAESAREANRGFVEAITHQLSQPLSALRGWLEMTLQKPQESEQWRSGIAHAIERADYMNRLLHVLLQLAEAEERPVLEEVPLNEIAADVAEQARLAAESRGLHFTFSRGPDLRVLGNPVLLQQAVLNIVTNAVNYSRSAGAVRVTVRRDGHWARLTVDDQGPGVPADDMARIFDPFYRGLAGRRSAEGSGLGLAIAKRVVEAAGGAIAVSTVLGCGSSFEIRLPLAETQHGGGHEEQQRTETSNLRLMKL